MKEAIIDLLTKKAGRDVTTASGSAWLLQDIIVVTGEQISLNTVKRLTGVLPTGPDSSQLHLRDTTLNIIASYLGFKDYNDLQCYLADGTSQFRKADGLIDVEELPIGSTIVIRWSPDRELVLRRLDSGEMLVEKASNSQLRVSDRLRIAQIMNGYPLIAKEVIRNGQSLGPFTAAPDYGVTFVGIQTLPGPQ